MMKPRPNKISLVIAQLFLVGGSASAQTAAEPPVAALAYTGGDTRIGVGYDSREKLRGEVTHVFSSDDQRAVLGEAWFGNSAGGLQVDYHWQVDDGAKIAKVFAAWDRNRLNEQKATIGTGAEYESWFWGAYLSAGLTGRRNTSTNSTSLTETRIGTDAEGAYTQDVTTTTTTRAFDRAYEHGIGGRLGHFYENALVRLTVGADYEWGTASSRQTTLSMGAEKFFAGSPHSILITAAASNRSGSFETRQTDHQIGIYWRYLLGGKHDNGWQASKTYRRVDDTSAATVPSAVTATSAPEAQKHVSKVAETVAAEAFFDFDRTVIRPEAHKMLDDLAARLKNSTVQGPLQITGHTCDLGPAAYNQRLSEKRAAAVRDYLIAQGALPADRIVAGGRGEDDPKYPNTRAERAKNRRCEIEFTVVTDQVEDVAITGTPAIVPPPPPPPSAWHYVEEPVTSPWVERALRNPSSHKREVAAYHTEERSVIVVEGAKIRPTTPPPPVNPPPVNPPPVNPPPNSGNNPPVAQDDVFWWKGSQLPATLDVLANDHDPDGNPIHVVSVTAGSMGSATILPDGRLRYMWSSPKEGTDHFTYTIADSFGATATANVTIQIIDP